MMRIIGFLLMALISIPSYADDAIVARVNGAAITSRELEEAVDRLIPRSTYHGSVSEEKRAEFREKALEELVTRELRTNTGGFYGCCNSN